MSRQYLPHQSRRTEHRTPNDADASDGRDRRRVPADGRSLLAAFALATVVPLALVVVSYPAAALGGAVGLLTVAGAARVAADRLEGRRATVALPGTGLSVEVGVAAADGE